MKKTVLLIAFLLAISFPQKIFAQTPPVKGSSATIASAQAVEAQIPDMRVVALQNILKKHNSPLLPYASDYVKYADKYNVDWKLLPAISGVESTFGIALPAGSYNAYGWGGGSIYFKSWDEGIDTIDSTIRSNYMDKWNATTVWQIGPIYAASPTWSARVNNYMNEMDSEYIRLTSEKLTITL